MDWRNDDDRLLEALKDAYKEAQEVPADFIRMGKAIFTWRTIDAELAALTYDSARDEGLASSLRTAEAASLRALTFATEVLTIDLQVTPEALTGQLEPPVPGTAETLLASGEAVVAPISDDGHFIFRPTPANDFRLHCIPAQGTPVITHWINL